MNIVILEEPRSGTHLLGSILEANGWGFEGNPRDQIFAAFEDVHKVEDVAIRLRTIAERSKTDRGWVIPVSRGILRAPLVWKGFDWNIVELLQKAFIPCTWLRTRREDKIAQAVSYFVAQKTDVFHSFECHPNIQLPDYDEAEIAKCLMRLIRRSSWHREIDSFQHFEVVYEDICSRCNEVMHGLGEFLGETIEVIEQSRYQKMPDLKKRDYIARFRNSCISYEILGPLNLT